MAIKGNLRDFTITQLLNLINLARKTGTLVVQGPSETAWVSFRDGKLAYSKLGRTDNSLATVLYKEKHLNNRQYKIIREKAKAISDKELGLLLINANYLTQEDILTALQNEFVGVIYRLFTWVEGIFQFQDNILPPKGKITLKIGLENIIIEGSRQLREWEQLQDEIPSLDMALKFSERPGTNIRDVNLSVEEWRVAAYINPKNSIQQIARALKMNDLEIRRIAYGLIQAGLVELVRPAGVPLIQREHLPVSTQDKEEQRSLVNRLIKRIRSL